MGTIAVLVDFEAGHLLSSFQLAKGLRARGHRVCYLGLPAAAPLVVERELEFIPLGGGEAAAVTGAGGPGGACSWIAPLLSGTWLDGPFADLRPDAILVLSLYYPEAVVIRHRYGLPVLMLNPHAWARSRTEMCEIILRARLLDLPPGVWQQLAALLGAAGAKVRTLADLVALALRLPELVLLPRLYELPGQPADPLVFYVGASVDLERAAEPLPCLSCGGDGPLVYCSLGSQAALVSRQARRFFQAMLDAARGADWRLVLAVGEGFDPADLSPPSPNVHLASWVPQLAVLRHADLMVTHGGIGSVKECILMGVPMVTVPLMRDQLDSVSRVEHHGLGLAADITRAGPRELAALVGRAIGDLELRRRVAAMRDTFLRSNDPGLAASIVEKAMAGGVARSATAPSFYR